jgi:hypothetical protein
MADDLLFVYSSPGPVDVAEFNDWYDNEHVPNRLAVPGFGAVARFRAADSQSPDWLATYEIEPGTLDTPAYKALWETQSEREKRIMSSVATLDRWLYAPVYDSGYVNGALPGPAPVLMPVPMSMPPEHVDDMEAWYAQEHIPMLLAVPGWRRARRYVLRPGSPGSGDGPTYLSLHEIDSHAAFETPEYKAAISTPWRNRIVSVAIGRERRVFDLHRAFG